MVEAKKKYIYLSKDAERENAVGRDVDSAIHRSF
jgi:hypothetical protein